MPAVTYLSDWEAKDWSRVWADKDCDELLQEMRKKSGRDWVIQVRQVTLRRTFWQWLRKKAALIVKHYTLYLECHGEWQVMNLVTPHGGSNFYAWEHSREAVMNYMIGFIGGMEEEVRATNQ